MRRALILAVLMTGIVLAQQYEYSLLRVETEPGMPARSLIFRVSFEDARQQLAEFSEQVMEGDFSVPIASILEQLRNHYSDLPDVLPTLPGLFTALGSQGWHLVDVGQSLGVTTYLFERVME